VLRQDDAVKKLFAEVAPRAADRKGGYTRIVKLGQRQSDSVVIEDGVKAGERVVVKGQLGVTPAGKVRVAQPADSGNAPAPTKAGTQP